MGLRARLMLALVSVASLTALLGGWVAIRSSYEALKSQKQEDELAIARNIAAQVDESLAKARQTVEALARRPEIVSLEPARLRAAATLVTSVTELIDGIIVSDLRGGVIVLDQAKPRTENLLPPSPYASLVRPVLEPGEPRAVSVYRSRSGEVLAALSAPIERAGRKVGVVSGVIILANHSLGGIENIRVGRTGFAYLVDADGQMIVHPQRGRLLESAANNPPVRELLARREGVIEFLNAEGVLVLAAFAPVPETGWGVVVRQPAAESYARADSIVRFLALAFVACLAAAVLLGAMLSRRIASPLTALVAATREVTEGRLETRIRVPGRDEIGQLAAAFNEMTARLKAKREEAERAHRERLEAERRLARSEKMAAVGQLAAGLAHEIYNPLNVISGFAEVLLERLPAGAPERASASEICREAARCQKLVADLLHFSKPKPPQRRPCELGPLVEECLALAGPRFSGAAVELRAEIEPGLPPLVADPDQLKQVLLNLLLNACQAAPSGGTVWVRARGHDDGVRLEVEDTGPGIPEAKLREVFNPFFTTKEDGHGLGLAVCHALVEAHGGRIEAASPPGRGALFTVSLPLGEPAHA